MERVLKRVSLMVGEEQYDELARKGLNISGLIRDLIDDYLSHHKITVSVSEPTRNLYDKIVSNTGTTDQDVETYFREALEHMLRDRIAEMEKLHRNEFGGSSKRK